MNRSSSTLRPTHHRSTQRPGPPATGPRPLYLGFAYDLFTSHYSTQDAT